MGSLIIEWFKKYHVVIATDHKNTKNDITFRDFNEQFSTQNSCAKPIIIDNGCVST